MYKLPWVSRELYNRVEAELQRSEKERRELLEVLLGKTPDVAAEPKEPEIDDILNPVTGRLDADKLRRIATRAKAVQAGLIPR
jgi:hypothetical protein